MIDGDKRLCGGERQSLRRRKSDHHPTYKPRAGGRCHDVDVVEPDASGEERLDYDRVDFFDMGARGDFRHDAAIGPMLLELAEHDVGEDFTGTRR